MQGQGVGGNATGKAQCGGKQRPADAENSRQQTGMVNNQNGMQRASMVGAEGMVLAARGISAEHCMAAQHELHRCCTPPAVQGAARRELHALGTIRMQRTTSCHDQRNNSCSYTRETTRVAQSRPTGAPKLITGSMQVLPPQKLPPPSNLHIQIVFKQTHTTCAHAQFRGCLGT